MALPFYNWSKTAASNATADSTVNWAEGQSPSSVNDSARAMMASTAAFRDDTSGALVTGGTSTAYTLTSNQGFISKAAMNGAEVSFAVHATNGASPTLNIDGLGGDAITLDGANSVPTGTLIIGSVYSAVYYNSGNTWRLKDFYQLPFTVPVGGTIDYFGTTTPNSNFVFPYGQAVSRTTYSALFTLLSTTFGVGDGSTTFNVPDLRGRIPVGKDDMGGSAASRLTTAGGGVDGATLGAVGGSQNGTIAQANLPAATLTTTITDTGHTHTISGAGNGQMWTGGSGSSSQGGSTFAMNAGQINNATTGITASTALGGSGTAFKLVQPSIVVNKLLRII